MSLKDKFDAAVEVVKSLPTDGAFQPSRELVLRFYAYYMQATEGPCTSPKPSIWDIANKAKWEEWKKLQYMSKDEAMTEYINELKSIIETMSYSTCVEKFMNLLGPFYEPVLDEELLVQKNGKSVEGVIEETNTSNSNINSSTALKKEMEKSVEEKCNVPNIHDTCLKGIQCNSFENGIDEAPASDEEFSDLFYSTEENASEINPTDITFNTVQNMTDLKESGSCYSSVLCSSSGTTLNCHDSENNNHWCVVNSSCPLSNLDHTETAVSIGKLGCKKDISIQTRSSEEQNCSPQDDSSSTDSSCSPRSLQNNGDDILNIKALSYARGCALGGGGGCEQEGSAPQNKTFVNDQVSSSLVALQCAMNETVMRLRSLESLLQHSLKNQKSSKGYKVPLLNMPPVGAVLLFVWPFIVHWIMYMIYRHKKK